MVSVALAAAGMGGQAIATASNAGSLQEEADHVEFDLDGKKVRGWLWRSPFKEGDIVDAAVVWQGEYFELVALANPADRTIALYPHCVRGRRAFYTLVFRWWLIFAGIYPAIFSFLFYSFDHHVNGARRDADLLNTGRRMPPFLVDRPAYVVPYLSSSNQQRPDWAIQVPEIFAAMSWQMEPIVSPA